MVSHKSNRELLLGVTSILIAAFWCSRGAMLISGVRTVSPKLKTLSCPQSNSRLWQKQRHIIKISENIPLIYEIVHS
jgi:hypothetical protein